MKIVNNSNVNVVRLCTLKPGDVFMTEDHPDGSVYIRTNGRRGEHTAVDLSNGELWDFGPDKEVIPLPDAYMTFKV